MSYRVAVLAVAATCTAVSAVAVGAAPLRAPIAGKGVTGPVVRVNTASDGMQANGTSEEALAFSPDGTRITFDSSASNLVDSDLSGYRDVFVKTLATGATVRVSTNAAGAQGNGHSLWPVFSPDGTSVAFVSEANNLVNDDANNRRDVFLKNLDSGAVVRVTQTSSGIEANGNSWGVAFSPGGDRVAFYSEASNLILGDTNGFADLFIKTLSTGQIERLSTDSLGAQADGLTGGGGTPPAFSADGDLIAFDSDAANLVATDTNLSRDIFVKQLSSGEIRRVSTAADGSQAMGSSRWPLFSPDGGRIAFSSDARGLVPGMGGRLNIYVKTLSTGAIQPVDAAADGTPSNGDSYPSEFSPDGTRIAFWSNSPTLIAGDTNNTYDVFIKTLKTGAIARASTTASGAQANGVSSSPVFSPDGRRLGFTSGATNLVADDTNAVTDLFIKTLKK